MFIQNLWVCKSNDVRRRKYDNDTSQLRTVCASSCYLPGLVGLHFGGPGCRGFAEPQQEGIESIICNARGSSAARRVLPGESAASAGEGAGILGPGGLSRNAAGNDRIEARHLLQ